MPGVPSAAKSLMPTILAIMLTIGGGLLLITGIILDSMSKMINRILGNSNNISPDPITQPTFKSDNASKTIKNSK